MYFIFCIVVGYRIHQVSHNKFCFDVIYLCMSKYNFMEIICLTRKAMFLLLQPIPWLRITLQVLVPSQQTWIHYVRWCFGCFGSLDLLILELSDLRYCNSILQDGKYNNFSNLPLNFPSRCINEWKNKFRRTAKKTKLLLAAPFGTFKVLEFSKLKFSQSPTHYRGKWPSFTVWLPKEEGLIHIHRVDASDMVSTALLP